MLDSIALRIALSRMIAQEVSIALLEPPVAMSFFVPVALSVMSLACIISPSVHLVQRDITVMQPG